MHFIDMVLDTVGVNLSLDILYFDIMAIGSLIASLHLTDLHSTVDLGIVVVHQPISSLNH